MTISDQREPLALRLLVVEDEALIAMMLEDILVDLGHEVVEVASSIHAALAALETTHAPLDAAILDANLGGASAAPVADALRAHGVPFILASGYEGSELKTLGFEGTSLRKPYRPEDVSRALECLFGDGATGR
jgi:CheY-like chemotaxis protein